MHAKRWVSVFFVLVAAVMIGLCGLSFYAVRLPDQAPDQETLLYGQQRLTPGLPAGLRVVVRQVGGSQPIAGAKVKVALRPAAGGKTVTLYEGTTDVTGSADVAFTVPAEAATESILIVETNSGRGRDRTEQPVTVVRDYKTLLTTDKPIYQPGQVIHIRVLALGAADLQPAAEQPVELTITDAKGNKVFRRTLTTSAHGVAAADFQLANEVNTGDYKLEAVIGNAPSETTVVVKPYVLPKFKVSATPDQTFYLPGEKVTGALEAAYFFGKPVERGKVVLTGYTFDVQLNQVFQIEGETDAEGHYAFEFTLPDYFVGGGLEQGTATFILEAAVTDSAAHTERANVTIPVARERILIEAVAESGELVAGVENIVYIITAAPDGTPVPTTLTIQAEGREYTVTTDAYGLGQFKFIPSTPWQQITFTARDAQGHTAQRIVDFQAQSYSPVLLRPERAVYRVGETAHVDIFSNIGTGALYLDIVRAGQTVSTRALEPQNGHAQADIDLTPELYGTLELHAYTLTQWGEIQRDTRLIVVDAPRDLTVTVNPDQTIYAPGAQAGLDFSVTGTDGAGVPATLGLAAVDEAVYALQEQDPGFLKVYFLLEKELLEPKYDLHGFTLREAVLRPETETQLRAAQEIAAQASLAGASASPFSLSVNTHNEAVNRAYERQAAIFKTLTQVLFPLALLLPLAILGLALWQLARERVIGASLLLGAVLLGGPALFLALLPTPEWVGTAFLDRLSYWLGELFSNLENPIGLLLLPVAGLVGWIALLVYGLRQKEAGRVGAILLLPCYAGLLPLLVFAAVQGRGQEPAESAVIAGVIAFLLPAFAFLVWGIGEVLQRRVGVALASFALIGLTLAGPLVGVFAVASLSGGVGASAPVPGFRQEQGVILEEAMPMEPLVAPLAMATPAPAVDMNAKGEVEAPAGQAAGNAAPAAPRLRTLFGETMAWLPELRTDEQGRLHVDLPLYDNITTWRLTTFAHSDDGRLGATTTSLRVFQDFFVDFDLPYALTQHDEVALPVAVYNYLAEPQTVRLVLEQAAWFELLGAPEQTVTLVANDVQVVRFRIRVTAAHGRYRPTVWAYGTKLSDATTATHDVLIQPDGKPFEETWSDRLSGTTERRFTLPADLIPGTAQVEVKLYPGILSQVVEGMDTILVMPSGCFEQTSSGTYPDVLALDYMKTTDQSTPEIQMKAEQYINIGYQRLTTFEVPGGGFSLFGDAPADRMLTAYGLMEFTDMARVYRIDEAFVERAAQWLMAQQASDGSWENDRGLVHEQSWSNLGDDRVPVTAYIVWALVHAGYGDEEATRRGLSYVREHAGKINDPYALALVANALVAADPSGDFTRSTLDRLAGMAKTDGDAVYWESSIATMMGSEGQTGSLETTALAAYAFIRADSHADLANGALLYLIQQKDPRGTWHSTQATILALKALMASVTAGGEQTDATVTVSLNGGQRDPVRITKANYDVVHTFTFDDVGPGENQVRLAVEGKGQLMAQVTVRYYRPWSAVPEVVTGAELLAIQVQYDRTQLAVEDTVQVTATVTLQEGKVDWALVDLGVPPGFTVLTEELEGRVARDSDLPLDYTGGRLKKFELTGRQILVYLQNLSAGEPLVFTYRLRARFPVTAQAPASQAYDYYNPGERGEQRPVVLVVRP